MLLELHIENVLLIEKLSLSFGKGFTAITGQTGAGKSILLDSLSIILGNRVSGNIIRPPAEKALIVAVFDIAKNQIIKNKLLDCGFDCYDQIVVKKIITKNGSKIFINDIPTSVNFIASISLYLIEMHSQFEQIDLLSNKKHLEIVDQFAMKFDQNFFQDVLLLQKLFTEFKNIEKSYFDLKNKIEAERNNIEYLIEAVNDIGTLNLKENELNELYIRKKYLIEQEKISTYMKSAMDICNSAKFDTNAIKIQNIIEKIKISISEESHLNHKLTSISQNLDNIIYESRIMSEEIDYITSSGDCNDEEIKAIEDRIADINQVARKYKKSPLELEEFFLESKKIIDSTNNIDIVALENLMKDKKDQCFSFAKDISNRRKIVAQQLTEKLLEKLTKLKMELAKFKISFEESELNESGIDKATFMISMNPGLPFSPIKIAASGGELSRFMLAFKSTLSTVNQVKTVIFDEIDSGISGNVAYAIAKELQEISQNIQVICVTHNPQVAACANNHMLVQKTTIEEKTTTQIITLESKDEKILAIAHMISSAEITKESLENAKSLLGY
jgi:DNA repair protein RecN (Recombination protein N)